MGNMNHIHKGDIVWDIGANAGAYSISAAKAGARVFAFEPAAINCAALMKAIQRAQLAGSIDVLCLAVGEDFTLGRMYITELNSGARGHAFRSLHDYHGFDTHGTIVSRPHRQWCFCATVDALVAEWGIPEPNHVRIGAVDAESNILRGMHRLLYAASGMRDELDIAPFRGSLRSVQISGPGGILTTYGFEEGEDGLYLRVGAV